MQRQRILGFDGDGNRYRVRVLAVVGGTELVRTRRLRGEGIDTGIPAVGAGHVDDDGLCGDVIALIGDGEGGNILAVVDDAGFVHGQQQVGGGQCFDRYGLRGLVVVRCGKGVGAGSRCREGVVGEGFAGSRIGNGGLRGDIHTVVGYGEGGFFGAVSQNFGNVGRQHRFGCGRRGLLFATGHQADGCKQQHEAEDFDLVHGN